jgi:hypothetical protein
MGGKKNSKKYGKVFQSSKKKSFVKVILGLFFLLIGEISLEKNIVFVLLIPPTPNPPCHYRFLFYFDCLLILGDFKMEYHLLVNRFPTKGLS